MKAYLVIGILMAAGLRAQPQDCSVNVYVVTRVSMPAIVLLGAARSRATAMFHEIGVNLRMREGIPARDPSNFCGAPIVVQFEDAADYRGAPNALARAAPYQTSGTCIHVFLDRVVRVHPDPGFTIALLAHVMVHEITHVIENIDRHSDKGVMKANWSGRDYQRMERDPLPFAPEDVDLIRAGLAKRFSLYAVEPPSPNLVSTR